MAKHQETKTQKFQQTLKAKKGYKWIAYVHSVLGVWVLEDERLLDLLVRRLKVVKLGLVVVNRLLFLLESLHVLLYITQGKKRKRTHDYPPEKRTN